MFGKEKDDSRSPIDIVLVVAGAVGAATAAGVTAYFQNKKQIRSV